MWSYVGGALIGIATVIWGANELANSRGGIATIVLGSILCGVDCYAAWWKYRRRDTDDG